MLLEGSEAGDPASETASSPEQAGLWQPSTWYRVLTHGVASGVSALQPAELVRHAGGWGVAWGGRRRAAQ